ncbi:MAG: hypothetical protein V1861_03095 [Candidatus Micrarchaeota archaeon]
MIESITKAFNSYSKTPFLFIWGSLMYLILLIAFFFAGLGLVLAYFISLSVFGKELDLQSLATMSIFGVIALAFIFFSGGLNAALARAYRSAIWKEKTSLTKFYAYALEKAPEMFGIMLLRDLLWLLLAGPGIAVYVYFLKDVPIMDILTGLYVISVTFMLHLIFTPAFISAGALGTSFFSSMKHAFEFMRKRHIFFITIYSLYAVVWFLNFVPFVQFITLFFAYPVLYGAMVVMFEDSLKNVADKEEDEE